jgi:hypothetical protein
MATSFLSRNKHNRDRVDAVSRVLVGHPLAEKDVPEVAATLSACDLRPPAVGIRVAMDGARALVVERGPSAAGVEFVGRSIQKGAALAADIVSTTAIGRILHCLE